MDLIIVVIIVGIAVFFSIRNLVKTYRGNSDCGCGSGCGCTDREKREFGCGKP